MAVETFPLGRALLLSSVRSLVSLVSLMNILIFLKLLNFLKFTNLIFLNALPSPSLYTHTVHFLFEASLIKKLFRERSKEFMQQIVLLLE